MEERKYYVKGGWIFNLESMNDKMWCLIYDVRDGKIQLPFTMAGKTIRDEGDLWELKEEAAELCWTAKRGKVTSREYGRIKQIVSWRVAARYTTCIANGMDERDAGGCFEEL